MDGFKVKQSHSYYCEKQSRETKYILIVFSELKGDESQAQLCDMKGLKDTFNTISIPDLIYLFFMHINHNLTYFYAYKDARSIRKLMNLMANKQVTHFT